MNLVKTSWTYSMQHNMLTYSEPVAHEWRKIGHFWRKIEFVTALDLMPLYVRTYFWVAI